MVGRSCRPSRGPTAAANAAGTLDANATRGGTVEEGMHGPATPRTSRPCGACMVARTRESRGQGFGSFDSHIISQTSACFVLDYSGRPCMHADYTTPYIYTGASAFHGRYVTKQPTGRCRSDGDAYATKVGMQTHTLTLIASLIHPSSLIYGSLSDAILSCKSKSTMHPICIFRSPCGSPTMFVQCTWRHKDAESGVDSIGRGPSR
jgi:hypothetical protein